MILCCGEALIDMLPRETAEGASAYVPHVGGAIFNSAVALGRLGAESGFLSGLSSDLFGRQLQQALADSRVDTSHAIVSKRPTTLAFVSLVDGQASYMFYDENTAGRMLRTEDLPAIADGVDAMLFGGISLIAEPCGSAYEALMAREHAGRTVMLDPNIRADFIPDAAAHAARLGRMIAMADIVKVSEDDLAWFGEEGTHAAIAGRWLEQGPKLVVITGGEKGATAYTARDTVSMPARDVRVVDTVGAGDTFNAGLLTALSETGNLGKERIASLDEETIANALAFAASVAAVVVSRSGADAPWRGELR